MKYIIKNCNCFDMCDEFYAGGCKNISDCKLKQVVEKCKEATKYCDDCNLNTNGFAEQILYMLEIEEKAE